MLLVRRWVPFAHGRVRMILRDGEGSGAILTNVSTEQAHPSVMDRLRFGADNLRLAVKEHGDGEAEDVVDRCRRGDER